MLHRLPTKAISVLALCLLSFTSLFLTRAGDIPRFDPTACPFTNVGAYPVDCGWLTVPEDHANPNSKTIRLAVAILRSLNPRKAPDPVVYLAGGPGGAFVQTAPLQAYHFGLAALLAERDVILVDQRGMGLSQPKLSCIPYRSGAEFFQKSLPDGFYERVQACRQAIEAQGINPALYTVEQNAADFADLRLALGYPQVNLYSTSWGTKLGQVILRDHPEGVRSAILDSVLPINVTGAEETGALFDRSFGEFERACQADAVCRTAYPNIRQTYMDTYNRLQASPVALTLNGHTVWLTGATFGSQVYMLLRSKEGIEKLPGFITAMANGDYRDLYDTIKEILNVAPEQIPDHAPYLTMHCATLATTTLQRIEASLAQYPAAIANVDNGPQNYRECEAWGMPPSASTQPADSAVPTLILVGQFDPLTPPEWGRAVAQNLPNSTVVELPWEGHGGGATACGQTLMSAFLRKPTAKVSTDCLAGMTPPNFILTVDVTRAPVAIATALLAAVALLGVFQLARALGGQPIAWAASFHKMGWLPLMVTALALIVLILDREHKLLPVENGVTALQLIIPLAAAIQAALVFSPDEEPGLEMLLALPRPVAWLVMERFAVALLAQTALALLGAAGILLLDPAQNVGSLMLSWLPPTLFLSGLALYVTLRSRVPILGVVVAGFVWMVFGFFGSLFAPGGQGFAFPFNVIQPFLWPLNINATAFSLLPGDYALNRLFLAALGIGFVMLALRQVRSPEAILLNAGRSARRKATSGESATHHAVELRPMFAVTPVAVQVRAVRQWAAIAIYEYRMHWSRRTFKVLTLTTILSMSVLLLVTGGSLNTILPALPPLDTVPADQSNLLRGLALVMLGGGIGLVVMTLVLPLLVADTLLYDRQYQVEETLRGLPVPASVYLSGKIAGVWLASLASLVVSFAVVGLLWRLRAGAYNLTPFLDWALVGVLPLALINSGIGVLLGGTQPNRRRAALAAVAVFLVSAVASTSLLSNSPLVALLPGQLSAAGYYLSTATTALVTLPPALPPASLGAPVIYTGILAGLLELVALFGAVALARYRSAFTR
jgi:pimeloyl-ACP methyl ester carboxylesterase